MSVIVSCHILVFFAAIISAVYSRISSNRVKMKGNGDHSNQRSPNDTHCTSKGQNIPTRHGYTDLAMVPGVSWSARAPVSNRTFTPKRKYYSFNNFTHNKNVHNLRVATGDAKTITKETPRTLIYGIRSGSSPIVIAANQDQTCIRILCTAAAHILTNYHNRRNAQLLPIFQS
jgi:hypothetical protein